MQKEIDNFFTCQPSLLTKVRETLAHLESVGLLLPQMASFFKNYEFGEYSPKASAYDKDWERLDKSDPKHTDRVTNFCQRQHHYAIGGEIE